MALHVETSWCPYQLFHRTFSINLTASVVSCQSCVVYTTFVGNSVLSYTTSKLNYWQVRLRCLTAADTDRLSHSPLPPGTMSSILFAKHVSFEHSVSFPRPVITSRRKKKQGKIFQHPIDSHSQSASSSLISPHFAAGAVGVGHGAASFLATESTGTVLIDIEEREENSDVEEREKERERGSNLRRQRLASLTAQVLVAQTTQPVQKNRLRDEL